VFEKFLFGEDLPNIGGKDGNFGLSGVFLANQYNSIPLNLQ